MLRAARTLPFFRIIAILRLALVARRHLQALSPMERRRGAELIRRAHDLTPAERAELRALAAKLEPGAFAGTVARTFSPFRMPGRRR